MKQVPAYRYEESASQGHSYLVCIFVYNEGTKLAAQLSRFPLPEKRNFDVVIGDDGSSDGSTPSDLIARFALRGIVRLEKNQGLSANIKAGLDWALKQNYKGLVMINGNDRDDPEAISRFIEKLEEGFDYVQGSRFLPGGRHQNTPSYRYWAIRLVHAPIFSLASLKWMTDTTNGYRAFSASFLKSLGDLIFQERFQKYEIEQYLAWKAIRTGKKVCEIPVSRRYPENLRGSSFTKISPGIGWYQMLKPLLCLLFRLYP
jgi:glycosyltransferase involved in cell wall biosynthesis